MAEGVFTRPQPAQQFSSGPVQTIEGSLTPQEMEIVNYHRNSIKTGQVGRDPEGRPVTVYSNTIQIPEGPHQGKFVTVPGWFGGKLNTDEQALWRQWGREVNAGKWPIYTDPNQADARAKHIHGIMDLEGGGTQESSSTIAQVLNALGQMGPAGGR